MCVEQQERSEARKPTEQWRRLPDRIKVEDMTESVPQAPPPSSAEPAGDPDTAWMLRYAG
jgi:hypothetical protein